MNGKPVRHAIRRFTLNISINLALLIAGLGLWSYWFHTKLRAAPETQAGQAESRLRLVLVKFESGWITASLDHGAGYAGRRDDERAWWGNVRFCREPGGASAWFVLPWWEPFVIVCLVPATVWLARLRRRGRPDENDCRSRLKRSPGLGALLVKNVVILALVSGTVAALSFWNRFDMEMRNREEFDYSATDAVWLHISAIDGWCDIEFQFGTPMGGGFIGPPMQWYGGFTSFSSPQTVFWWLILPGWLPVGVLALMLCIPLWLHILRRRRRLLLKACGNCGYMLVGNMSGTCPECGSKAGDRRFRPEYYEKLIRNRRRRKPLRWAGVGLLAFVLIAWVFSLLWTVGRVAPGSMNLVVGEGCLWLQTGADLEECWDARKGWFAHANADLCWEPYFSYGEDYSSTRLPLWMLVLTMGVPTGLLWWYDCEKLAAPVELAAISR